MEFINELWKLKRAGRSVRKTLLRYGNHNGDKYEKPLSQLTEQEVTTLIKLGTNSSTKEQRNQNTDES